MSFVYDMNVLSKVPEFDAAGAAGGFDSLDEYFRRLSGFVEKSDSFLRSYNPTVVVFSDEVKQQFLDELEQIAAVADSLKMSALTVEIDAMRGAIGAQSVKELSDGLVKFHAKVKIVISRIAPAIRPDNPTIIPVPEPPEPPQPTILAVDDKPEVLSAVNAALNKQYRVVSVTNSKTALDMLRRRVPDLMLLGAEMSEMSGYTLADTIREDGKFKSTPVLFMTSVAAAMGEGHVCVPIDRAALRRQVEKALGGRKP